MISASRCVEKIYIHIYITISIDYRPNELQNIGISDIGKKNPISCVPNIGHDKFLTS